MTTVSHRQREHPHSNHWQDLLYTDRDCCCATGPSKSQDLFVEWTGLAMRLTRRVALHAKIGRCVVHV